MILSCASPSLRAIWPICAASFTHHGDSPAAMRPIAFIGFTEKSPLLTLHDDWAPYAAERLGAWRSNRAAYARVQR